jgi:cytochrome c biogenesis protein CcmG/thiol:disulfide interchange protein DsbE
MRRLVCGSIALVLAFSIAGCAASSDEAASSPSSQESHPLVGNGAPAFSRPPVGGGAAISTDTLRGKVAIVDFWATWCEPCKKSFPKLEELNVKYRSSGLQIIGVSEDDDADGIPMFAKGLGTKFPLVWDQEKSIASKWQPKSMPTTFVVDRSGIVRFVHFGFHDGEEALIEQEIKSLL